MSLLWHTVDFILWKYEVRVCQEKKREINKSVIIRLVWITNLQLLWDVFLSFWTTSGCHAWCTDLTLTEKLWGNIFWCRACKWLNILLMFALAVVVSQEWNPHSVAPMHKRLDQTLDQIINLNGYFSHVPFKFVTSTGTPLVTSSVRKTHDQIGFCTFFPFRSAPAVTSPPTYLWQAGNVWWSKNWMCFCKSVLWNCARCAAGEIEEGKNSDHAEDKKVDNDKKGDKNNLGLRFPTNINLADDIEVNQNVNLCYWYLCNLQVCTTHLSPQHFWLFIDPEGWPHLSKSVAFQVSH